LQNLPVRVHGKIFAVQIQRFFQGWRVSAAMLPGDLKFSSDKRLRRAADFARMRTDAQMYRGSLLSLGVAPNSETAGFRAGFITSRKIGNAVQRNRVRRRLREIVRLNQTALRSNIWLVTIAQAAAASASYRALEDEWLRLAKRASILARS
jgi:ribonuclease P protein component